MRGQIPREKSGRFTERKINLAPDGDLGYIVGLVIGDGSIQATKTRNYRITLETTREDYADLFEEILKKRLPSLTVGHYRREKKRQFPNGLMTKTPSFAVHVSSKQLYELLRPCKQDDFHWQIPGLALKRRDFASGFLQGIFDAEGSVYVKRPTVSLFSKHKENLLQVQELPKSFGVKSRIEKRRGELRIVNRGNCIRFQKEVGFRYEPKRKKLAEICQIKYPPDIVKKARALRQKGHTYREIAAKLGVKHRTSVREWLTGEKLPHSIRHRWVT